jgi:sugar (pentulose or hexulose) kinase
MSQSHQSRYFIGIDVGTQGARVILMDSHGEIFGKAEEVFPLDDQSREEQSTLIWWEVCLRLLRSVTSEVKGRISLEEVISIAVTSTSGTVVPLDQNMAPIHKAIMYSDPRSAEEGKQCREMAIEFHKGGYAGFNSSSGLSKIVWFISNYPEKAPRIAKWVHACEYITGRLSGAWGISDHTNVLKTGYDVKGNYWPAYLFNKLNLRREWLPQVVASGTPVGNLSRDVASALGLSHNVKVVAGMTDGCASQIASGAVRLGDWNTTIGTTLVIKGVTRSPVDDPSDRLYNHRHPEGFWMPGGAANIGADWITKEYGDDLANLNEQAKRLMPTKHLAYPLRSEGERFPFISPSARGFCPPGLDRAELYTANLEGVAYIERYAFEMTESLSGEKVEAVYTAGGGSKSEAWLKIRSNTLGLPIYKMKNVSGAVGAAILAASKTVFSSVIEAAQAMTQIEKQIFPEEPLIKGYNESYGQFINLLKRKGYIENEQLHA